MSDSSSLLFMAFAYGAAVYVVIGMAKARKNVHRPIPDESVPMQRKLMTPAGAYYRPPLPPPRGANVYSGMLNGQHG